VEHNVKKYDFFESLPLIMAMIVFIAFKVANPSCEEVGKCMGSATLIMAVLGSAGSFAIYKWAMTERSKVSYYSVWQKRRLLIGSILWFFLFLYVLIDVYILKN